MDFTYNATTTELLERLGAFMDAHIYPNERRYHEEVEADRWGHPPVLEELKAKAQAAGLWNLFLPDSHHGAGLSNVEYAPLCEMMGRVHFSSQVFNCSAPIPATSKRWSDTERKRKRIVGCHRSLLAKSARPSP